MNWNCIICGDAYGLDPQPARNKGYGTLSDGQDVKFICPVHLDMIQDDIVKLQEDFKTIASVPA